MLPAKQEEVDRITEYMLSQAPDLTVEFVQKVYSENVLHVRHEVWDVHTDVDRWWVITEPMNLYAQDQFPNMDLALTFHVGLCLRIPRAERPNLSDLPVEPFAEAYRYLEEAHDAVRQSSEVADYQAIGVRCREALLAFIAAAQRAIPWTSTEDPPNKADLKAWADHVCNTALAGAEHEHRRHLYKTLLDSAWKFVNWLTHAKSSHWHDAEAGIVVTENAVSLCTTALIRHVRGVPDRCPDCGSQRLRQSAAVGWMLQTWHGSGRCATSVAGPASRNHSRTLRHSGTTRNPRHHRKVNASFRLCRCGICVGPQTRLTAEKHLRPSPDRRPNGALPTPRGS